MWQAKFVVFESLVSCVNQAKIKLELHIQLWTALLDVLILKLLTAVLRLRSHAQSSLFYGLLKAQIQAFGLLD